MVLPSIVWPVVLNRWLLPLASGLLLVSAFPPFGAGQIAWVALIPLLFALQNCGDAEAFRRGYITGLAFFGGTVWWVVHVSLPGMVGLVAFLALYFAVAALWFARLLRITAERDAVWRNLLVTVLGAAAWVTLEWIRGRFLLGGFAWNFLGASQYKAVPLIQIARETGVLGVSAILCLVNFSFFFTGRRVGHNLRNRIPFRRLSWEFYFGMLLIAVSFMRGLDATRLAPTARTLRLSLVQGNIPQTLKWDPAEKPLILERYGRLTREWSLPYQPDLIIWPETATPEPLRYDQESFDLVTNLTDAARAPLLTGTVDYTPFAAPPEPSNAAMLVTPDGDVDGIYRKMHLVPFGEYVPWERSLPFMKWLTPITGSFQRGVEATVFEMNIAALTVGQGEALRLTLDPATLRPVRFGVVICFEDTVADVYRAFIERGVDFMVNLTNDGWFKESPAAEMHLANAVFRAVETRRPLVRATNHGVTAVIDQNGFIRSRLEPFVEGVLNVELALPADAPLTGYVRRGDRFAIACALLTLVTALAQVGARRWQTRRGADNNGVQQ